MLGTKGEAFLVKKMKLFAHVAGNDWALSRVEGTLPAAHASGRWRPGLNLCCCLLGCVRHEDQRFWPSSKASRAQTASCCGYIPTLLSVVLQELRKELRCRMIV